MNSRNKTILAVISGLNVLFALWLMIGSGFNIITLLIQTVISVLLWKGNTVGLILFAITKLTSSYTALMGVIAFISGQSENIGAFEYYLCYLIYVIAAFICLANKNIRNAGKN